MRIHSDLREWQKIPPITINAGGNLRVQGWDQREIEADTRDEDPTVELSEEKILIDSGEDLTIRLPFSVSLLFKAGGDADIQQVRGSVEASRVGGNLKIESASEATIGSVGGDLYVRQVEGNVMINRVGGNFKLENAHDVQVEKVGGDLSIHRAGALSAKKVGGDASVTDVAGPVTVSAGGDLRLKGQGEVTGNAGGDASLDMTVAAPKIRLNAKGDIRLNLPSEAGAKVRAVCGGDLRIEGQEETMRVSGPGVHSFALGASDGSISLVAGGDVNVTGGIVAGEVRSINREFSTEINQDMARASEELGRLGQELGAMGAEMGRDFGSLGQKIADKITSKLRQRMERQMHKAGARAARTAGRSFTFQMPEPPRPPNPPGAPFAQESQPSEPISDEERMLILQMVEEGKITADEAEKLLAALEGNYEA
jgi:hypothetical protein